MLITSALTTYYLPIFYLLVFLSTLGFLWKFEPPEAYKIIFSLTLLYLISWIGSIWEVPVVLMLYEFIVFTGMWVFLNKPIGVVTTLLTLGMVLANGVFVLTEGYEFYRLSIVNLLFLAQCLFIMAGCLFIRFRVWDYVLHKIKKHSRDSSKMAH